MQQETILNQEEVEALRTDTPVCKNVVHFNNAGASLQPKPVYVSTLQYLQEEYLSGGYEAEKKLRPLIDSFATSAAKLIGAQPDEIAFLQSATEAWQRVFFSVPWKEGDVVVTCANEYGSQYLTCLKAQEIYKIELKICRLDDKGSIDLNHLEEIFKEKPVKLFCLSHIPSHVGNLQPVAQAGELCKKNNVLYLLDACQSVGHLEIDVNKFHCDFLTATGRKYLRGPRGTGFLYVRKEQISHLNFPFMSGLSARWDKPDGYSMCSDALKFESYEIFFAGRVGLTAAINYCLKIGVGKIEQRILSLSRFLREQLLQNENVVFHEHLSLLTGINTVTFNKMTASALQEALSSKKINTWISKEETSYIDMKNRNLKEVLRVSLHYYNTEDEIKSFVSALNEIS